MALEGRDHLARGVVIDAGFLDAVAVTVQRALQPRHQLAALAGLDRGAVEIKRGRAYPMPDAGFAQQVPGKFLARILLARRIAKCRRITWCSRTAASCNACRRNC